MHPQYDKMYFMGNHVAGIDFNIMQLLVVLSNSFLSIYKISYYSLAYHHLIVCIMKAIMNKSSVFLIATLDRQF